MRLRADSLSAGGIRRIASMGLLLALSAALNFAENLIPALPMLPPGVKLGLSNIVTIYGLFYMGAGNAFCIAFLKSIFVLLTRGITAGALSLTGGLCSLVVMLLVRRFLGAGGEHYFLLSISGAVFHNIGQLMIAAVLLKSSFVYYYLPVLLVAGVLMGCATAALLRAVLPALRRISAPRL